MRTKVLIIGGAGFIGCNLAKYLIENRDYEITANEITYRGKWKTLKNEICYKQSNWLDYKCVLVYVGFNDGMKLYFVEKVGRGLVYVAGNIYEEIYKSIKL